MRVIPGRDAVASPESITTIVSVLHYLSQIDSFVVMDSGPRHSASQTRVNALMARPE